MKGPLHTMRALLKNVFLNSRVRLELISRHSSLTNALNSNGFFVERGVLSDKECKDLRGEIDNLISNGDFDWCDDLKSDFRIYAAETKISYVWLEKKLHLANSIASSFHGAQLIFTDLIAKISYKPGNLGSGGGWHRDSIFPQFKTILYLTDACEKNGAFEIVPMSHRTLSALRLSFGSGHSFRSRRFTDNFIIEKFNDVSTLSGSAGDQLFVNTNAIHRGRPLEAGSRYALTRYYFDNLSSRDRFLKELQRLK